MNLEIARNELEYHAALIRFEKLDMKKVQEIFDLIMKQGIYYDEFIDIEYPQSNIVFDFIPAFELALQKLSCKIPKDKDEAVWVILKYHITNIANDTVDSLEGLERMMEDIYWSYNFYDKTIKYIGDSHGIEYLVSWYWEYDDIMVRPAEVSCNGKYGKEAMAELKKEVVKSAKQWLERYH